MYQVHTLLYHYFVSRLIQNVCIAKNEPSVDARAFKLCRDTPRIDTKLLRSLLGQSDRVEVKFILVHSVHSLIRDEIFSMKSCYYAVLR